MGHDWLKGAEPPRRPSNWRPMRVYNVSIDGRHHLHALEEQPWGIWTHYVEKTPGKFQTTICEGDHCPCKKHPQVNKRWIGYLPVVDSKLKDPAIIQVSRKAAESLEAIARRHGSIMSVRLAFFRVPRPKHPRRKNDEVRVEADGPGVARSMLPAVSDVRPTVLLMYGYTAEQIDNLLGRQLEFD
jgi:hypothetical protein